MKPRLFITLLAFLAAPAGAQTAQDAWDYLESQCGANHQIEIADGIGEFTDHSDDTMTVNLQAVEQVVIDSDGDTMLRCRKLDNPFATSGERLTCMQADNGQFYSHWYLSGCQRERGLAMALLFLIKQHNPEVKLLDMDE